MMARLRPPLINGTIMANARMPISGISNAMARKVSPEKKRAEVSAPKASAAAKMKAQSIVTVGSRPSHSVKVARRAPARFEIVLDGMTRGAPGLAFCGVGCGADAQQNDDAGHKPKSIRGHPQ